MAASKSQDTVVQYNALMQQLQQRKFVPIYFLMGDEPYYIDKISRYIEDHLLNDTEKSFNQTVFYGRDITCSQLVSACKRFPMMSEYQVIIVKEAQNLKETDFLIPYIENPLSSTILVMCWKSDKVDKRTKFYKSLSKLNIFQSNTIPDYKLTQWILDYIKERQLNIDPRTADLIASHLGNDLSKIENEISKVLINKPDAKTISLDDVENYIGISKDFNVFELQDAIAKRNFSKAYQIIDYFSSDSGRHSIIPNIALLYSYFSKVYALHFVVDKNNNKAVMEALGLYNTYNVEEYKNAARNYSKAKVEKIMGTLLKYDLMSKGVGTSGIPDKELYKELLVKIIQ